MPKMKTHSGAKKRFRITGTGKVMREQAGGRHLLEHKSSRFTRSIANDVEVSNPDAKKVKKHLGRCVEPTPTSSTGLSTQQPRNFRQQGELTWHA